MKKYTLLVTVAIIALFILASVSPNIAGISEQDVEKNWSIKSLDQGLVGYWKFDEGSGTNASDSSGCNNTGILYNSPVWVDGKYGEALYFNGTDNYVEVPDNNSLDFSSAVTVASWINLPQEAHYSVSRILDKDAPNGGSNLNLDIYNDSGYVSFDLGYGSGFTGPIMVSNGYVIRNLWTHVAATYDGSYAKIYINGVLDSNVSWTAGFNTNNGMPLCIGRKNYQPSHQYLINATLDEVKIYNRSLSENEIWELYIGENQQPNPPTINGPNKGKPGVKYDYIFNSIDPDGDSVKYIINWGDNTSNTTNFNPSGINVTVSHNWTTKGRYTITVISEDEFGVNSQETTKAVTIPRNRVIDNPLLSYFENHPLLNKILKFFFKQMQV